MPKYQKYVNALFLLVAAFAWLISSHYLVVLIGQFQLGRSLGSSVDVITHALPILVGIATFFVLRSNATAYNFTLDSVAELTKVTWPSSKDVRLGTIVVIVTVLVAGVVLGVLDLGFTSLVRAIMGT